MIKLLLLLAVSCRAEVVPLSFQELPRLVAAGNENVSGAEALADAARSRTGYLGRTYLPSLEAHVGGERFQTGPFTTRTEPYGALEARLNLYRGGRDRLEERLRESQLSGFQAAARKDFAVELADARKAFWELVSLRETAGLLRIALSANEQHVQTASRRIARGLASETDRLDFQIYASQLNEEIESREHASLLVEIRLAALLGHVPGTRFETPEAIAHEHDDALLSAPFDPASHPGVTLAGGNAAIAGFQRSHASRWWTPSLDLYGGYSLYTLRDRDSLERGQRDDRFAGVRLSLGLFDGLQSKANATAFSRQADGYRKQADQRSRAILAQVDTAKEALKHEHELIHRAEERIEQGQRYLALTLDEYERGVKNSIDVLGAAQRGTSFAQQYAERRREYQTARCDLLALLGQ